MKTTWIFLCLLWIVGASSLTTNEETKLNTVNGFIPDNGMVLKLNFAIDMMLKVARFFFTKHGQLTIALPTLNKTFGHDLYTGIFTANDGYFRNVGSLQRTGDVEFIVVNGTLSLQVAMGLAETEAGYNNYTLSIVKIHQSGNMTFNCENNSLMMKMTFRYSPKCSFYLEYIKFDVLDGIKVNINGLGAFQILYNELSNWLISNFEGNFRVIANKKMHERLERVLNERSDDFCKYFPHF